jgi:phenylalanyl-tRNA synthetase alpha subunit
MTDLDTTLAALEERLAAALSSVADERALEDLRVAFLGRSGEVTTIRRGIGALPPAERPTAGKVINAAVERMEAALANTIARFAGAQLEAELAQTIDVTLPGPPACIGSIHPIRRVIADIGAYFTRRYCRGPRSRATPTISTRSTSRRIIRHAKGSTRSICGPISCCARTPRRCKSARCASRGRRLQ